MHEHISLGLSRRSGRVPLAEIFRVDASSILSAAARDTCLHRSSRNGEDAIKLKIQTSSVRLCAADDVGCGITRGVVRRRSREKSCGPTSLAGIAHEELSRQLHVRLAYPCKARIVGLPRILQGLHCCMHVHCGVDWASVI